MPSASPSKAKMRNAVEVFTEAFGELPARITVTKAGDIILEPVAKTPEPAKKGEARQWGQA